MDSEYLHNTIINYLEYKLPPELFITVKPYITSDKLENKSNLSQADRVYNHLKENGFITNMQCHLLYGIRHCPAVIRDLKKKLIGTIYFIDTEPVKGCDRYGNKTNWVKYILKVNNEKKYYERGYNDISDLCA